MILNTMIRSGLIAESVGNNMTNHDEDVLRVKNKLARLDLFDNKTEPEPHGIITREMDEGIKAFQKENGLRVDGALYPGGETENALLGTRPREEEDRGTVGFGGNVSGTLLPEKTKTKRTRPTFSTAPIPEEQEDKNGFTTTPSGIRVNKSRIAEALEDYLLAQIKPPEKPARQAVAEDKPEQTDTPVPERKPDREIPENKDDADRVHETQTPPVPKRKAPKGPEIFDNSSDNRELRSVIKREERPVPHLYKDSKNNITVGIGRMIPNVTEAKKLPFTVPDGQGGRRRATDDEIERAFKKVQKIQGTRKTPAFVFDPAKRKDLDDLRLDEKAMEKMLDDNIKTAFGELKQKIPKL